MAASLIGVGASCARGARGCAQACLQRPRRGPVAGDGRRSGRAADRNRRKRTHAVRLAARMAGSGRARKIFSLWTWTRQGWKPIPRRLLGVKLVPKKRKVRKLRRVSPACPKAEKLIRAEAQNLPAESEELSARNRPRLSALICRARSWLWVLTRVFERVL